MLTALSWIKQGAAKAVPIREDERELEQSDEEENEIMETEEKSKSKSDKTSNDIDDVMKEFNLDEYDDEEDAGVTLESIIGTEENDVMEEDMEDEDFLSDVEDTTIRETDSLLIGVHSEEDVSHLDVYIYEEKDDNLYVHHDLMLSSHPLCVEWLDYHPKPMDADNQQNVGNLAAVGTFEPEIEIWDLDVLHALAPVAVLGGESSSTSTPKKNLKKKLNKKNSNNNNNNNGGHQAAVLGLAWNRQGRNFLASCSADHTIKLWDLSKNACLLTMTHHKDKVQGIQWHPTEATVLLSGSYDKTASVTDVRMSNTVKSCKLVSDVECLQWNVHNPQYFMVSMEDGSVVCYDARSLQKSLWTLSAHSKPASGLAYNTLVPNLLATASPDKTVKLWDISEQKPKSLHTIRSTFPVFGLSFYGSGSNPFLLAAGGQGPEGGNSEKGEKPEERIVIWNTRQFDSVAKAFPQQS